LKHITCEYRRGNLVESVHHVSAVVVEDGRASFVRGEVDEPVFMRSCAKPLQACAVVESGAPDAYRFTTEELAVVCGSHPGDAEHVRAVSSILKKAGLTPAALRCGTHPPSSARAQRDLARAGKEPTVLHNNCSGKHAGMVSAARCARKPIEGYLDPAHPLQRANLANVCRFSGLRPSQVRLGTDGCSAPTFGLSLRAMARAMAALCADGGTGRRVREAMMAHPAMVGRPCVQLMSAAPGRLVSKGGAEGVYLLGLAGERVGMALKVHDGNARAWVHVIAALFRKLRLLGLRERAALSKVAVPVLRNHAGLVVGDIRVRI
jgi:L-asparaginase II